MLALTPRSLYELKLHVIERNLYGVEQTMTSLP